MALQKWIIKSQDDVGRVLGNMIGTVIDNWTEGPYQVVVEPYVYARTIPQNNLYWKWMGVVVDWMRSRGSDVANDEDTAKRHASAFFQERFLGTETPKVGKWECDPQLISTKSLSTGDMFSYMEKVHAWCMNAGLTLPVPEESQYKKLRDKNDGQD